MYILLCLYEIFFTKRKKIINIVENLYNIADHRENRTFGKLPFRYMFNKYI